MRTILRSVRLSAASLIIAAAPLSVSAAVVPVSVLDGSFSPQNVTANPGDTVVWTNYGSLTHTVVSTNGMFQSSSIPQGANFSYTFGSSGSYSYYDSSNSSMTGTVTVGGSTSSIIPTYATQTTTTGTSNTAALQAQAQALLEEISQLEAQLAHSGSTGSAVSTGGATTINSSSCPNIGRVLSLGTSGADVSRLQQFLAQSPGIYPSGLVTGYYGSLTQTAVEAWQTKYNIVSSGTPSTTGFGVVGPRTAAAIALLCSTGSTTGSTNTSSSVQLPQVGGAIQITPTAGPTPLSVTAQITVNITNSCLAATYVLNFGDGSQSTAIQVPSGSCVPQTQVISHTYTVAGTYTIVLAAGGHQTTATVTASGTGGNSGIPNDSMKASITSGVAPLTVTFTGTVANPSSLGCSGTCSDTINFGDGGIGLVQLPAVGTWQSYVTSHAYSSPGTYTAQLESVTGAADGAPTTITVTGASSSNNSSGSGSYGIVTVNPDAGGNPLAVNATIAVPSCASYGVNWGDSSGVSTQTAACQSGGSSLTVSHTYSAAGKYTIALDDGNGNQQATAQVSIVQ